MDVTMAWLLAIGACAFFGFGIYVGTRQTRDRYIEKLGLSVNEAVALLKQECAEIVFASKTVNHTNAVQVDFIRDACSKLAVRLRDNDAARVYKLYAVRDNLISDIETGQYRE